MDYFNITAQSIVCVSYLMSLVLHFALVTHPHRPRVTWLDVIVLMFVINEARRLSAVGLSLVFSGLIEKDGQTCLIVLGGGGMLIYLRLNCSLLSD